MKQLNITFLLTVLISMVGTKAFAYDIAVANDDGVTIYYNFINDSTELEVTNKDKIDWNRNDYHYNVVIPESVTYNGKNYNVTSIGWEAFSYADLTSVTIPNSVNTIDYQAFYNCWNLTSFNIPISVTSIGSEAFDGTPWYDLQPDGLVYVGKFAYKYKGEMPDNTSITIKDGTLGIAQCAFEGCVGLTSITIPNSVTFIGYGVFSGCSGLTTIVIPNSVTKVDGSVFSGCTSLTSVTISDNITFIGSSAFSGCSSLSSITIPENVTSIGSSAFFRCSSLSSITIPENVTSIGSSAFSGCSSLTSITIPENVTIIGDYAFSGCNNLATITFPNNVISIGRGAFSSSEWYDSQPDGLVYAGNILYKYKGEMPDSMGITIIDGTKGIAGGAFSKCNNLVSITIPNSVVTIGNYAFQSCTGLTTITIPDSVTTIGDYVFSGCHFLTSIDMSNKVTSIGEYAFNGCLRLASVSIPNSTTSIDFCAFHNCRALTTITIPNSITDISYGLFAGCSGLTSINIPNSVTTIGDYAFSGCSNLDSINIPTNVTYIGEKAFYGCSSLTSVTARMTQPISITDETFPNQANAILYVPEGSKITYEAAKVWKDFKAIFEIGTKAVSGITFDKPEITVLVGQSEAITAAVEPIDATNQQLIWLSSNSAIATVENGIVTAVAEGTATIVARSTDGTNVFTLCQVTVETEADTDISALDNTIYLERAEGFVGSQMRLSVKMKNTVEVQGYQFDLYLPAGVTVAEDGDGFALAELSTARTTAAKTNYFDTAPTSDGGLRVLCGSSKGYTFSGNDGEVAVITLNIAESVAEGEHAIVLRNVKLSDANSTPYSTDYLKSTLAVAAYTPGDANNDGSIDVADFIAVANHILGNTVAGFVVEAADVNEDGSIDVADFIGVANMILHQQVGNSRQMRAETRMMRKVATDLSGLTNAIYVEPVTASPGTQQVLSVRMKNATEVAGYEFSLQLPEGVTVATDGDDMLMAELSTERTTATRTNYFDASLQTDGTLKVLCGTSRENPSTGKLYTFSGNDGEVARITVNVASTVAAGDYAVLIKDALISDPDAVKTTLQSVIESTLTVGESTDYDVVLDENDTNVPEASDGAVSVLVRRTINANEWSTICLPFSMTEAQVYDAFGDDVELAEYMEHEMNNEATEITVVFDDALLAEDGLMANYPYIIRTSRNITEFLVEGVTISPDENEAKAEFTNGKTGSRKEVYGTFMGTYHAQTTVPDLCLFLSGNKFWYSTGQTKMKAFRGYFDFEDKLAAVEQANARVALRVKDRTAGLKEVVNSKKETVCFDLQGRRIKSPTKKGLYVVNGKKMVIR